MTRMRLSHLLGCLAVLATAPSAAEEPGVTAAPARPEVRVSLQARDTPLRAALKSLVAGTSETIAVDRAVADTPVRLMLKDVPLEQALRLITRHVSRQGNPISYAAMPGGFRVMPDEPPAARPEDPNRVTITVRPKPEPAAPAGTAEPIGNPEQSGTPVNPEDIGKEPPRIEGTPERRRSLVLQGPILPPRRFDPLDTPIGRGAFSVRGRARLVTPGRYDGLPGFYRKAWDEGRFTGGVFMKQEAAIPRVRIEPLTGNRYRGSQSRRKTGNNGGRGSGSPDAPGGSGGGGGIGRRPF